MGTIKEQMAYAQYFASIYADFESREVNLETIETTEAFESLRKEAMPRFYAAVLVFFVKAKSYFQKTRVGKYACV